MPTQNYANHRQFFPLFHFVLLPVLLLTFIASLVNLYIALNAYAQRRIAVFAVVITACVIIAALTSRVAALKAQDRAIRAEENLRHYVLTGKLLDPRLSIGQIIGLRFAGDTEFVELARRAAEQGLSKEDIKKAVKSWRPDLHRV